MCGYYKINTLPTFVKNLKLATRYISDCDDDIFWSSIYINIQRTLAHEESLWDKTIIYPESIQLINDLADDLRLAIGGHLTYHY